MALRTLLPAAVLACLSASTAAATPVDISVSDIATSTGVLHAPGTIANNLLVDVGAVLITGSLGTFESYCVDLQHFITPGQYQTDVDTMANWNQFANPAPVSPTLGSGAASWLYLNEGAIAAGNRRMEAALQLAIWNALYDNDYSVSSGSGFWVTNLSNTLSIGLANGMLNDLKNYQTAHPNTPLVQATWLRTTDGPNHFSQDFIAPVPEPSAGLLLCVSLTAVLVGAHRRPRLAHRNLRATVNL